jgi:hypothetical protein
MDLMSLRLVTPLLLAAIVVSTSAAAKQPRRLMVRGDGGDPDLMLDFGRSLRGHPLRGARKPRPGSRRWLSPIEKARLDARRIGKAPNLSLTQKLERLIAVARHRMPVTEAAEQRYQRSCRLQVKRQGFTRISTHARTRTGRCRERAFLLRSLLREAGLPARVRYGVFYDAADVCHGGHAWVETRVQGGRVLLEPSLAPAVGQLWWVSSGAPKLSVGKAWTVPVNENIEGEGLRQVRGVEAPTGLLYVPTADLRIRRSNVN